MSLIPLWSSGAAADSFTVTGSWYSQLSAPSGVSVDPNADVPDSDLAVSATAGQPARETYLHVDTSGLAPGATVSSVILTIKEDPSANSANASGADGKIKAFPVTKAWDDGIRAGSYADKPPVASDPVAAGHRGDDGTWTFDITGIISAWLDGTLANNGIALQPTDLSAADNFDVIYGGGASADGDVITPASSDTSGGSTSNDLGSTTATTFAPSSDTGALASSSGSSLAASPVTPAGTDLPNATAATTPAAAAAPSTTPVVPATRAAAAAGKPGINAGFILAGLGLLGLVGAAAFVLGDAGEPTPPRAGSVLRALDRRAAAPPAILEAKEH